ncbi:MAG TPA: DNA translocase FtsK [Solirubrobacterales bacterium]|nr:DNA translocase FtsK [Solirubrobacterales bacterium]
MPSWPFGKRGRATSKRGGGSGARKAVKKKAPAKRGASARAEGGGLEQRTLDLIGLGALAAGLYLGFVLYGGWDGGKVGEGLETGLTWLAGSAAYAVPMLLAGIGGALVMRPFIRYPGALNAGALLLLAGLLLAFAAETAGLGPDRPRRGDTYFDPDYFTEHGGAIGELLYWAAATLFQSVGAHIIAVLMVVSGALLLSGRPIAGLIRSGADAGRRASEATGELARTARRRREDGAAGPAPDEDGEAETELVFEDPGETMSLDEEEHETTDTSAIDAIGADGVGDDGEPAAEPDEEPLTEEELAALEVEGDPDAVPTVPEGDEGEIEVSKTTPMGAKRTEGGITESEERNYRLPPKKLLKKGSGADRGPDKRDMEATAKALLEALGHFGVEAKLVGTVSGPHVSRFELQLAPGTKVGKIAQLKDDLAYALASTDIRILAPIPGKRAVGVEVPNSKRKMVRLGDIYQGRPKDSSPLACWLGKDISGQAIWTDLAKMPHILIAGTTGSGKSGCVNAILSSMLLHSSPNELRLVLVDPKQVELNHYDSVPHLLTPVVTSPRIAANVLENLIGEMESRYSVMGEARARNLDELNRIRKTKGEAPLPHILCVIDELADLMMVAPGEVEDAIIRLAQKSRAVGIHLILATQRPSTDIITGTIKVNIPARIAFAVASQIDSRVILDQGGAESLLGQGDMLFRPVGSSKLQRVQGAFVTEDEIAKVVSCWNRQGEPNFDVDLLEAKPEPDPDPSDSEFSPDEDELLEDAIRICVETDTASVSMIQRRLRVGYTRAGRLIDMLERRGVISGYEGSKAREVLIGPGEIDRVLAGRGAARAEADAASDGDEEPQGEGPPTEGAGLEQVGG